MQDVGEGGIDPRGDRTSEQPLDRRAGVAHGAVRAGDENEVRALLDENAVPVLAAPQREFGVEPVGHVPSDPQQLLPAVRPVDDRERDVGDEATGGQPDDVLVPQIGRAHV